VRRRGRHLSLARLTAWPPHEDETLALFVGRQSLGRLLDIVLEERGGAPLHYLIAAVAAHSGGGLTRASAGSALFALASIPPSRTCSRGSPDGPALVATVLVSASWVLLFHGVYGRMYSLFLFTSALSYLALLWSLDHGRRLALRALRARRRRVRRKPPVRRARRRLAGRFVLLVRRRLGLALASLTAIGFLASRSGSPTCGSPTASTSASREPTAESSALRCPCSAT
jgi:hypothetical protein